MALIWYAFLNGIIFIFSFIFSHIYWLLAVAILVFLYWQEITVVEDEYVQDMRELL